MKNKIITTVVIATLMAGLVVGAVSADFNQFTSEERTEIKTLMQKSKAGEELTTLEQSRIDEIKANFEGKRGEGKGERGEKGDRDGNGKMKNNNLTDEERVTIEAMTDEEREEYRETKKAEMQEKREEMRDLMQKSRAGEELTADEQAKIDEMKANFKGKRGKRGGGDRDGSNCNR